MKAIAKQQINYSGKLYKNGDIFDIDPIDFKLQYSKGRVDVAQKIKEKTSENNIEQIGGKHGNREHNKGQEL